MRTTRTSVRFALFLGAVAAAFAAALLAGQLVGPIKPEPPAEPAGHAHDAGAGHTDAGAGHADGAGTAGSGAHVGGLAISQDGYTLRVLSAPSAPEAPAELAFRIERPDGAAVTSYTTTHERPLHLIVVRRDLVGFQHLHPTLGTDGSWRIPLTLPAAGIYRLIADFAPDGRTDAIALGADVALAGSFAPQPPPQPTAPSGATTEVDGYTVRLARAPESGAQLGFTVERGGVPVTDLEPYLGALGHLVMLRSGDLAYLHNHPETDRLAFSVVPPSSGAYRLYLQFQHGGTVHTAAFTVEEGP